MSVSEEVLHISKDDEKREEEEEKINKENILHNIEKEEG
jgi:hypothetical protein